MKRNFCVLLFLLVFCSIFAAAQKSETDRQWNQPVKPFRIIGNVYYVGAAEITSFLITTPKGHFLLDSGYIETVPQIKQNIVELGFKIEDVKILLNSQAHYDHAGGLAELKRLTGARLFASRADAIQLANGGIENYGFGDRFPFERVVADESFADGKKIKLGGTVLKANITSGHTKGCTTWTAVVEEGGKKYDAIFVCSTSVPGYKLVDNKNYPTIAEDYAKTFERLRKMKVDVFLASHGNFFNLQEKMQKLSGGAAATNPFIDPNGYAEFIKETEKSFLENLKKQREEKK